MSTILRLVAVLVAALCVAAARARSLAQSDMPTYTLEEVSQNGYIIYGDLVLDVSTFRHPGGRFRLQRYVGKDATAVLDRKHNAREQETARSLAIGTLAV